MDKRWITKAKWSRDYVTGVNNFLEFSSRSQNLSGQILFPCKSCINRYFHSMKDVKDHLISKVFFAGYVVWNRHGEEHCIIDEYAMTEASGVTPKLKEDEASSKIQACMLLAEDGLIPEDENVEANEMVFNMVMGPKHPDRVRTQRFSVTPTQYFPRSTNVGSNSGGSSLCQIVNLREEVNSLRTEMREYMQQFQMQHPSHGSSKMITFQIFHWRKGTPFAEDQGVYNNLTWWEQIENDKQLTSNRKFLTVVPLVL